MIRTVVALLVLLLGAGAAQAAPWREPPFLQEAVASHALPPIEQRLPQVPLVVPTPAGQESGRYGGDWRMMVHRDRDTRLLCVYGYARLVVYDTSYAIVPDLLAAVDVVEDRIFTLHLRPGHKWSDGQPFTAEDFRYWWEDVANNEELSPSGPPQVLIVEGEPPVVEFLDDVTVRYTWSKPNPFFLPAMAGATPLFIFSPAHYLKPYHARYADPEALAAKVEEADKKSWASLHNGLDSQYKFDNPDLPTLQPWMITTKAPAKRYVAVRNPYYHRVDTEGRQLPYIDRVLLDVTDGKLIAAKTGAGEADLQARGLAFNNYTFLKEAEERNDYTIRLWRTAVGSQLALYPNLNVADPAWRALLRDVRFRRALSLAIDRHEVNQVIYYGLALEANNTVLPMSSLYDESYAKAWATFDVAQANALLDEIGLTERDSRGVRLLPDGRPLEVIVETAGEDTEQSDVLELVHDGWMQAGVKLFTRPLQVEVLRNRVFAGQTIMAVWTGYENGIPTADMSPAEFAPTMQQSLQWPMWGQYIETAGESGEPADMPEALELLRLNDAWRQAPDSAARADVWGRMLALNADQVFTIGLVSGVLQPVVVTNRLRGVPEEGIFNWEPGAQFGIYRPDAFWFDTEGQDVASN